MTFFKIKSKDELSRLFTASRCQDKVNVDNKKKAWKMTVLNYKCLHIIA